MPAQPRLLISFALLSLATLGIAGPKIQDLSGFGGYATSIAGHGDGGGPWPEGDIAKFYTNYNTQFKYFTNSAKSTSTSFTDAKLTANGTSTVGLGYMKMGGSNSGDNNSWRHGSGSGGWIDTLNFNAPGKTGQAGLMTFTLTITGTMATTGFSGWSQFVLANYKNKQLVPQDDIFKNAYGPHEISTDRQGIAFGVTSTPTTPGNRIVNRSVLFTVPFTFGTAFEHGVFALSIAKTRSVSGVSGVSTSAIDFTNTVTWNGINQVLDNNGNPVAGWSMTSASGTNWAGPVPEPASFAALGLGAATLLRRRRTKK
jgi:hypothetical protein